MASLDLCLETPSYLTSVLQIPYMPGAADPSLPFISLSFLYFLSTSGPHLLVHFWYLWSTFGPSYILSASCYLNHISASQLLSQNPCDILSLLQKVLQLPPHNPVYLGEKTKQPPPHVCLPSLLYHRKIRTPNALTQLCLTLRPLKLVKWSCLTAYFQLHLITPYIYSSLEFTKLFDTITFNLRRRRLYEVSKVVTFILVLLRRKQVQRGPGLAQSHAASSGKNRRCSCTQHSRRPVCGLAARDDESPGPVSFLFKERIWQKNKTVELILAAAAGKFATPSSCGLPVEFGTSNKAQWGRQRDLPFVFDLGSPFDFLERKEVENLHFCHCYCHHNYAGPLEIKPALLW